jgi:alpha-tubulin suppressor-like RCC1 family protein
VISRGTARAFTLALSLTAVNAGVARAQSGTITIAAGSAPSANVAPGAKLTVPVIADMSAAGSSNLASLVARVTWTPALLTLDSIRPTDFGFLESTIGSGTASLATFAATGTTATTTVANLYFTAGATTAGSRVQLAPTAAGNELGASLTGSVHARSFDVCVAPQTMWGDANGDGNVNIIDAQQIARFSVGLSVANPSAMGSTGDVNDDDAVDIVDAQQIARSVVDLSASPRIGTTTSSVPAITSIAVQPTPLDVGISQTVQLLAVPQDANGVPLTGCASLDWTTDDATKATVDANGIVTGVAAGSANVKATAVNGVFGTLGFTVSPPVVSVTMSRDTATIPIGTPLTLTAIARDGSGNVSPSPVTFSTSDASVATVSPTGQVTAVNVGPATITATAQGKSASTSVQVSPLAEHSLATGDDFSCVLSVAGAAFCWGSDSTFQLGDGTTTNRNSPIPVAVPSSLRFTQITAASKGVCALTTTQAVYCWGARFPSGAFINPFLASASLQVATMTAFGTGPDGGLCMVDADGKAWCLGDGERGQMGTGSTSDNLLPDHQVSGGNVFTSVTSAQYSVCGLAGTAAYCWGDDRYKSLGTGSPATTTSPNPVTGGLAFASLVAGRTLTCGVTTAGAGYCWGTGFYGGDGSGSITTPGTPQPAPTPIVGGLTFKAVWGQAGPRQVSASCGLTTDGTAYCWGSNSSGQLGTTAALSTCATAPSAGCTGTPTLVTTSSKFATLRPGGEHACGITTDHKVLCWGRNDSGQLGDGTNTNRSTPVPIFSDVRVP